MNNKKTKGGGVKAFSIQGRLYNERERLHGMTDQERAFRKQWIKDQHLAPHEPVHVPEMYKARYNPLRRFYMAPLNAVEKQFCTFMNPEAAKVTRSIIGKVIMGVVIVYSAAYYFKYGANDWTRRGGWRVMISKPNCFPGDPGFPLVSTKKVGPDYATRGFENSPI